MSKKRVAWLLIIPGIIVFSVFKWYPIITSLAVSMFEYKLILGSKFVEFSNFKAVLFNNLTWIAFRNTFYFAFLNIALCFLVPIIVAILLLEMKKNLIRIMMILWFIPAGSIVSILLWKWYYNPSYGLFNGVLQSLGLPTLKWLNDPRISMICIVLPGLIMYGPGLIYIATLQSIPDELYEAAELEGAGFWRKIWSVTLPRMRPIVTIMLILSVISSLEMFNQAFIMTEGGPANTTLSVVMVIYDLAFIKMNFGYGSALGIILFLVIFVLTVLQRRYFKENLDE